MCWRRRLTACWLDASSSFPQLSWLSRYHNVSPRSKSKQRIPSLTRSSDIAGKFATLFNPLLKEWFLRVPFNLISENRAHPLMIHPQFFSHQNNPLSHVL